MEKILYKYNKAVLFLLFIVVSYGFSDYLRISRESKPDIQIPLLYVYTSLHGISPDDAERLLVKPIERELSSLEGLKEMRSVAVEGFVSVALEFDMGIDIKNVLNEARNKLDLVKSELPRDATAPVIEEISTSKFPVLNVILSGGVSEDVLAAVADDLKDLISSRPNVLSVNVVGKRIKRMLIEIDPISLEAYNINPLAFRMRLASNNSLAPVGKIEADGGDFSIQLKGMIKTVEDIKSVPIAVDDRGVVTIGDVANVREVFEDYSTIARANGRNSIVLEVTKRSGTNIIETISQVRNIVNSHKNNLPVGVMVTYSNDSSEDVQDMLSNLENNILISIVIIMVIMLMSMGWRSAILVSMAVPVTFLMSIIVINYIGFTLNIVVLFSLILSVGILVDAAIVVTETADTYMAMGQNKQDAYVNASSRMWSPLMSSTATTVVVFVPLFYWPGVIGEFMFFLPATVVVTLVGSFIAATLFLPVLGGVMGGINKDSEEQIKLSQAIESGDLSNLDKNRALYMRIMDYILDRSGTFILFVCSVSVAAVFCYLWFGKGVQFFPEVEPGRFIVKAHSPGNLSLHQKSMLTTKLENVIQNHYNEIKTYNMSVGSFTNQKNDVVAVMSVELRHWEQRRTTREIIENVRNDLGDVRGVYFEFFEERAGPVSDKPINVRLSSEDGMLLFRHTELMKKAMGELGGFVDISDDGSLPEVSYDLVVDRTKAAMVGADIDNVGYMMQLITSGAKVGSYVPDWSKDELDIVMRFPKQYRNIEQLKRMRVNLSEGPVPISNFIKTSYANKISKINRADQMRSVNVESNLVPGYLVEGQVASIMDWVSKCKDWNSKVSISFKGEHEDQNKTMSFLLRAFIGAVYGVVLVLIFQFNSFIDTFIVITAIFFSTVGVFLGLLVTGQPFGVVMSGIGVIALSGIVVNNNILLIDAFSENIKQGRPVKQSIMIAGVSRVRAIFLTVSTTVFGLLPMILGLNINVINLHISLNPPSGQYWKQLSTTIAGGLMFATFVTLFFTPCCMMFVDHAKRKVAQYWKEHA